MTKQEALNQKVTELITTSAKLYVLQIEINCLATEIKKAKALAASNTFENYENNSKI